MQVEAKFANRWINCEAIAGEDAMTERVALSTMMVECAIMGSRAVRVRMVLARTSDRGAEFYSLRTLIWE